MNRPEILAPAGGFDSLTAAVYCGADAVYLGSKSLNARRNAGNFDEVELARAVSFCHERGVKVYQTLNILVTGQEIDELVGAVKTAASLGIDGVMVQDLGALAVMKACAPQLPVYASTQMAVHNLAGVLEAASLGCKRVVLARELSSGEIAHITANSPVEVEVFVHGALCMCLSGQCYLSSMLGGRSGNRGLCAQPCRLPFELGKEQFALSLKDLTLTAHLKELAEMGVASFKIEGRMKRPEYVAAAVTAVKTALDGGTPDLETLQKVFSRSGFTDGYYNSDLTSGMFGVRQREDVTAAAEVMGGLTRLATKDVATVPIKGAFTAALNMPIELTVWDEQNHRVSVLGEPPEEAHTRPTDEEHLKQSLMKTGGTPFLFDSLEVTIAEGLMLRASQLNSIRREALERLSALRSVSVPHSFQEALPTLSGAVESEASPLIRARCRVAQLSPELVETADEILLPLGEVKAALDSGVPAFKIIVEIPRIIFGSDNTISKLLSEAVALGIDRCWAGNLGALNLARKAGMLLCGGWSLNVTNTYALELLKEADVSDCELSFELALGAAQAMNNLPRGIIAYGSLPLMVFRNCPIKARIGCAACKGQSVLTDRKGIEFRVDCQSGAPELYNSVPLYLGDKTSQLKGFDFITLWFTHEAPSECLTICREYAGKSPAIPPEKGYTRGLYFRPVL